MEFEPDIILCQASEFAHTFALIKKVNRKIKLKTLPFYDFRHKR